MNRLYIANYIINARVMSDKIIIMNMYYLTLLNNFIYYIWIKIKLNIKMIEDKIFLKKRVSLDEILSFLEHIVTECKKDADFDKKELATWNANICSCLHRCGCDSVIETPFGVKTDGSLLILCMIEILKYGKISIMVNYPSEKNIFPYRMPYNTGIVGVLLENLSVGKKYSVIERISHSLKEWNM